MKNKLSNYKFSKIGTNPMRYLENFHQNLNNIEIGTELYIDKENFQIFCNGCIVFSSNSEATFRQNIDCWLCMGFVIIKKDKKNLIKIINENQTEEWLIEISKWNLLIDDNKNSLIDQHRKTIITKLLSLKNGVSVNENYDYEEVIKTCGKYEEIIRKDENLINSLEYKWGSHE